MGYIRTGADGREYFYTDDGEWLVHDGDSWKPSRPPRVAPQQNYAPQQQLGPADQFFRNINAAGDEIFGALKFVVYVAGFFFLWGVIEVTWNAIF